MCIVWSSPNDVVFNHFNVNTRADDGLRAEWNWWTLLNESRWFSRNMRQQHKQNLFVLRIDIITCTYEFGTNGIMHRIHNNHVKWTRTHVEVSGGCESINIFSILTLFSPNVQFFAHAPVRVYIQVADILQFQLPFEIALPAFTSLKHFRLCEPKKWKEFAVISRIKNSKQCDH